MTTEKDSEALSTGLQIAGGLAIAGGIIAAIWLGPAIIGGAIAGAGAKVVATGVKMAGKNIIR